MLMVGIGVAMAMVIVAGVLIVKQVTEGHRVSWFRTTLFTIVPLVLVIKALAVLNALKRYLGVEMRNSESQNLVPNIFMVMSLALASIVFLVLTLLPI